MAGQEGARELGNGHREEKRHQKTLRNGTERTYRFLGEQVFQGQETTGAKALRPDCGWNGLGGERPRGLLVWGVVSHGEGLRHSPGEGDVIRLCFSQASLEGCVCCGQVL